MKKLVIGADSAGYELKEFVAAWLKEQGIAYDDVGALSNEDEKPYFVTASEAARGIQAGEYERGILFCGTGMGMSIVANKFKGVYASCVESVYAARRCRAINNANVLCMGRFIVGTDMAVEMVREFLKTNITDGMAENLTDFLHNAYREIQALEDEIM